MKSSILSFAGPSTTLTQPYANFTFKYYMHGDDIGYFRWYWAPGRPTGSGTWYSTGDLKQLRGIYDGTSANEVSGEKQTNGNQSWKIGTIDLTDVENHVSGEGRMALLYAKSNNTGYKGDACFQRMKMTINNVETDLSPPSNTFTGWQGQSVGRYGMVPSSDMEYDWENGNLSFNTINTTVYSNGPWAYRTNAVPSGCSATGPCQEDGNDGSYYIFCETSNSSAANMYNSFRYAWFTTTSTFFI